jgi:hypothetical protein
MARPFFSVVIPTYNRGDLFPFAVQSILQQTFGDFEVVISDNCSSDDTPRVARQFNDPRVRYVRTPHHGPIADSWEFARSQAAGRLIIMLSDDDVLVSTALECFAREANERGADFIFCRAAVYRDQSFPGAEKNTLECPAVSGASWTVAPAEFVGPLFAFTPRYETHPSAYAFSKTVADAIAEKTGRFFWTNGVEFSAWPMAAVFSRQLAHIDVPLYLLGRTSKSWGSNMVLGNPGKAAIQSFLADIDQQRRYAPLKNFTTCNLMAEGMLTAQHLFPSEFAPYPFDEAAYIRATVVDLLRRREQGVDVSAELDDALSYAAAQHPALTAELNALITAKPGGSWLTSTKERLRPLARWTGVLALLNGIRGRQVARRLRSAPDGSAFFASGAYCGFSNILECAAFLGTYLSRASSPVPLRPSTSGNGSLMRANESVG